MFGMIPFDRRDDNLFDIFDNFQKKLDVLRGEIASGDYDAFQREFARGKELRDAWAQAMKKARTEKGTQGVQGGSYVG